MATTGNKVLADDFNTLFTRIEAVRLNHYNSANVPTANRNALVTTWSNTRMSVGSQATVQNVTDLRSAFENLSNSNFINTSFTSGITVPSVGDLLQASLVNTIDSKLTTVEGLRYSFSSFFTSASKERDFTTTSRRNSSYRSPYFSTAVRSCNGDAGPSCSPYSV